MKSIIAWNVALLFVVLFLAAMETEARVNAEKEKCRTLQAVLESQRSQIERMKHDLYQRMFVSGDDCRCEYMLKQCEACQAVHKKERSK